MAYLIAPTFILAAGLITDLRSRKIYNWLVGACIALALVSTYFFFGLNGLQQGAFAALLALGLTLPLVLLKVLGAGDMKLFFAFGLATTYGAVFNVLVQSLFWSALVGIFYALYSGQAKVLFGNILKILKGTPRDKLVLQKIPYTVPLFLAWISYLILNMNSGGDL